MDGKEKDPSVIIQTPPPEYEERKASVKKYLIASVVYGATVTLLMVAVVVAGAFMYGKVQNQCLSSLGEAKTPTEVTEDTVGDRQGKPMQRQIVKYDEDEVLLYHFSQPNNLVDGTVLALDYKRSVTGVYIPGSDVCFIIGGIDQHLANPFVVQDEEQVMEDEKNDTQNLQLSYMRADDFPALDHNVLPVILHGHCMDREVYWLEREFRDDARPRQKRGSWYGRFGRGGLTGGYQWSSGGYHYDFYGTVGGSFGGGSFRPSYGIGFSIRW